MRAIISAVLGSCHAGAMSTSSSLGPQLSVPDPFAPSAPPPRLYSPGQIGAAAVLGMFIAGVVLYATNQRRLGERRAANVSLAIGIVVMAGLSALAFLTPDDSVVASRMAHVTGVGLWYYAKSTQQAEYNAAISAGGRRNSNWVVLGITVGVAAIFLALTFAAGMLHAVVVGAG